MAKLAMKSTFVLISDEDWIDFAGRTFWPEIKILVQVLRVCIGEKTNMETVGGASK